MPTLAARLTARGIAAMSASLAIVAALVAGPAIPAAAGVGQNGPTELVASYDGYDSVRLTWEQVVYSMDGFYTDGYEISYTNDLGAAVDVTYLTEDLETTGPTGFLLDLYDLPLTPTVVQVRGTFSPEGASEWTQLTVDVGLANLTELAATADAFASSYDGQFTAHSRAALTAAIAAARALVATGSAGPDAVAAARTAMENAANAMVGYGEFAALLEQTAEWDVTAFTPGALARYNGALAAARRLLDSAQNDPAAAITQAQFDAARIALNDAYYLATPAPEGLAALLAEAESFVAAPASSVTYSAFSLTNTRAAIAAAKTALDDQNPAVGTLEAAVARLQAAFDARVVRPFAFTLALNSYAVSALADVTAASRAAAVSARAAALEADAGATATAETLTAAAARLEAAVASLVPVAFLRAATVSAVALVAANYTTTTWAYFTGARDTASALLARTADAGAVIGSAEIQSVVSLLATARGALAQPVSAPPALDGLSAQAPGLTVQVFNGMIQVSNNGGNLSFASGQFGYVPAAKLPVVVLPANPGLTFTPPPAFQSSPDTNPSRNPGGVDCEVRASVFDPLAEQNANALIEPFVPVVPVGPKKTFCNARLLDGLVTSGASTVAVGPGNPDYVVVEAFPATRPANGKLDVTFALPADAITGDVYLQYVYDGVYFEVNAAVLQSLAAAQSPSVTAAATSPVAALAQTGTDTAPLIGSAALLLLVGGALTLARSRRRVIHS